MAFAERKKERYNERLSCQQGGFSKDCELEKTNHGKRKRSKNVPEGGKLTMKTLILGVGILGSNLANHLIGTGENVTLFQVILEGLGLGGLLVLVCAAGIRKGAVGMVHFYSIEVQERCVELGLTSKEKIRRKAILLKVVLLPVYVCYLFLCLFVINQAQGFFSFFWQSFVILFVMNLVDRFLIDEFWVGHTKAWIISGTEDLMPYITKADKHKKWLVGTVGMAGLAVLLAGIGTLL